MTDWFTSTELAGLPGLPGTDRRVRTMAEREGWQARKRAGSKAMEYHISSLPPSAQMALLSHKLQEPAQPHPSLAPCRGKEPAQPHPSLAPSRSVAQASARQARVMLARVQVCRLLDNAMASGLRLHHACQMFSVELRMGNASQRLMTLAIEANDRPRAGHVISASAMANWHQLYQVHGDKALLPGARQKSMAVPAWAGAFLRRYQQPMKPSVEDAYRLFAHEMNGQAPSIHQVRRFLAKLSAEAREQGRMGKSELKAVQAYKGRAFKHLFPNDIWTADGHTFDAEISHPYYANKVFRPEITTFADIRTRRIVGFSVELAESSTAVLDGLRVSVKAEGVPANLYVDNGSGYKNEVIEGIVERIGTTMTHAIAYNSQAKGVIERINQLWVRLAKRLPSYIGADMDKEAKTLVHKVSRKALKAGVSGAAIVGWDAFIEMAQATVIEYNNSVHTSLNASPNTVLNEFIAQGWAPIGTDWQALDKLMMPMAERSTTRGLVQLHSRKYSHPALVDHHGDTVMVAYDIRDAAKVWVYDMNLRLICEAARDGHMTAYQPESRLADMREKRANAQINRLAVQIENKTGQKVAAIQMEHQPAYALDMVLNPEAITDDTLREQERKRIAFEAIFNEQTIEWAEDRHGRWHQYHNWVARADLTPEQKAWIERYPTTDDYAQAKEFFESFNGFEYAAATAHSR